MQTEVPLEADPAPVGEPVNHFLCRGLDPGLEPRQLAGDEERVDRRAQPVVSGVSRPIRVPRSGTHSAPVGNPPGEPEPPRLRQHGHDRRRREQVRLVQGRDDVVIARHDLAAHLLAPGEPLPGPGLGEVAMQGPGTGERTAGRIGRRVLDMAVAEASRPGWLARLLTHPIVGLDRYPDALAALTQQGVIKTYIEITDADGLRR